MQLDYPTRKNIINKKSTEIIEAKTFPRGSFFIYVNKASD